MQKRCQLTDSRLISLSTFTASLAVSLQPSNAFWEVRIDKFTFSNAIIVGAAVTKLATWLPLSARPLELEALGSVIKAEVRVGGILQSRVSTLIILPAQLDEVMVLVVVCLLARLQKK